MACYEGLGTAVAGMQPPWRVVREEEWDPNARGVSESESSIIDSEFLMVMDS